MKRAANLVLANVRGETVEQLEVRRVATFIEDRLVENGRKIDHFNRVAAVVAVIKNPWYGRGFVDDLSPEIDSFAPQLGELLAARTIEVMGGKEKMEGYGKAAMVGVGGELEHAVGLVHTLKFGNKFRELTGATKLLSSTDKRGGPGAGLDIPLRHFHSDDARYMYMNFEVRIPDAPRDDEILVALAACSKGRPHPRVGDRKKDEQELGRTYDGKPVGSGSR
jgi:hypothetical protein